MTTKTFTVRNVNDAFMEAMWWMKTAGLQETSRNGPVLVAPGPVVTQYTRPIERVLFNPTRDANPVFHLMEAIWMMAGADTVNFLLPYNKRFAEYAEPLGVVHGAYGHRWRRAFAMDQLVRAADILRKDHTSRRVVVQMWSSFIDLGANVRDVPCNTQIYFDARGERLNMTVTNRSNDMLWGAYGANVVHMSFLQEWMAAAVGLPVGDYYQFSNNFHLYTDNEMVQKLLETPPTSSYDFYSTDLAWPLAILQEGEDAEQFLFQCQRFVSLPDEVPEGNYFLRNVAHPLRMAYNARKAGQPWRQHLEPIPQCDWKLAFTQWTDRREQPNESQ